MQRSYWFFLPILLLGCGSSSPAHRHPAPLSVAQHEEHAQGHDAEAQISNERVEALTSAGNVECVDVGGPLNSGGERTPVMKPCWTRAEQNDAYLRAAEANREAAREHRAWAKLLLELEETACKDLGEIERETSPFVRRPDIVSVEEYREGKALMGARITFRKVKGLSKAWLTKSIGCHQARAAKLGFPREFMPHCPLALKHTSTSIDETEDTVTATLRSEDPIIAAQIYGRALSADSDGPKK